MIALLALPEDYESLRQQILTGQLDSSSDVLLLLRGQQLSTANVLQVYADEIDVLGAQMRVGWLFDFLVGEGVSLRLINGLLVERFGFFLGKKLFGRLDNDGHVGLFFDGDETKCVCALAPVENMSVTLGLPPVDERSAGAR